MLTPYFELSQTDKEIILNIKAPMANISETELNIDGDEIIFYSSPYYLRLHLPGKVMDCPNPGSFDADCGEFKWNLIKCVEGEYFPDLDLIGNLLNPKPNKMRPEIRLLSDVEEPIQEEDDDNEWLIIQEPFERPSVDGAKFGFADKFRGLTNQLRSEFFEILDITDSHYTDKREWTRQREEEEVNKFSDDHYLADFMDPTPLQEIISFTPSFQVHLSNGVKVELLPHEKEYLKNLGNKEYLLSGSEKRKALFSLVDILYAFAYNHRTTLGESTVESPWTVNKLSSTLSWLETFSSMRLVKISGIRRSLVYPLYRHWDISMAVVQDTLNILKLGRRQILKCLIEIHSLFNKSEPRYLLNQFYITDYCIWVQKVSDKTISKLADVYSQIQVSKADVELDLEELENAALIVQEEEREMFIAAELRRLTLCNNRHESESETSTSEDESETSGNDDAGSTYESSRIESDESSSED